MTTQFEDIAAAVKSRLEATTAVCSSIERGRARPVAAQDGGDAVVIYLRRSIPDRGAILGAPINWTTLVDVECYSVQAGVSGDSAVDSLLLAVHDRLLADLTLGGTADDVAVEDVRWDVANQAMGIGCAILTVAVQHQTRNNTLA